MRPARALPLELARGGLPRMHGRARNRPAKNQMTVLAVAHSSATATPHHIDRGRAAAAL